jgi:hypothetical protein
LIAPRTRKPIATAMAMRPFGGPMTPRRPNLVNKPAAQLMTTRKHTRQNSFSTGQGKNRPAVAQSAMTTIHSIQTIAERIIGPYKKLGHVN